MARPLAEDALRAEQQHEHEEAKANMLLADGVNSSPPSASVTPISTPPSSAPGMEPRPPVMTITKASSV